MGFVVPRGLAGASTAREGGDGRFPLPGMPDTDSGDRVWGLRRCAGAKALDFRGRPAAGGCLRLWSAAARRAVKPLAQETSPWDDLPFGWKSLDLQEAWRSCRAPAASCSEAGAAVRPLRPGGRKSPHVGWFPTWKRR